jgi:hypothetical protein
MPDSFAKTSTNKASKEHLRQKIPHSSFYLHQLNNQRPMSRDTHKNLTTNALNESVGDVGSRNLGSNHRVRRIQTGAVRKEIMQEMKEFTQSRINSSGGKKPSRSFK